MKFAYLLMSYKHKSLVFRKKSIRPMNNYQSIIYNTAVDKGLTSSLANLLIAQAQLESGNFSSHIFLTCNNAFGYKYIGQALANGPCGQSPSGNSYAHYNSLEDSTKEVADWILRRWDQFKSINNPFDYAKALKKNGYYGESLSNYASGLSLFFTNSINNIKKFSLKNPWTSIGIFIGISGSIGFIIYAAKKSFK